MGADIAWLLPAAVICLCAIAVHQKRAPRTIRSGRPRSCRRLAVGDGGGVQLHERNRAPVLHGGPRARRRCLGGHRRNAVVAEPFRASGPQPRWRASSWSLRSWRVCCWPAPTGGCRGCGRGRRRGGAATLLLVSGRLNTTTARAVACLGILVAIAAPAAYSVATVATPRRSNTLRRTFGPRIRSNGTGWPAERPPAGAGLSAARCPPTPTITRGQRPRWGRTMRRATNARWSARDGGRRLQRNRSLADAC